MAKILLVVRELNSLDAMTEWCSRLAGTASPELSILHITNGSGIDEPLWKNWEDGGRSAFNGAGAKQLDEMESVQWSITTTANVFRTVSNAQASTKPTLLILQGRLDHPTPYRTALRRLMDEVPCAVMVLRLGEGATGDGRVLLPCSGGPHSRKGLKLAADAFGDQVTALFVEPAADDDSGDVGQKRLDRHLRKAGVLKEGVGQKVIVSNDVYGAIREEVTSGGYGMLLIGASGASSIRRKLFGTVPDRLIRGSHGMSVAVIRGERPVGHRIRDTVERLMHVNVPQLRRSERVSLFEEVEEKTRWSFDFAALMILATLIASLGLIADSVAVVIGAMLVAPLMTPLIGGGLAVVQGNWLLWKQCQKSVAYGFLEALGIGLLTGWVSDWLGFSLTNELAARGKPSVLDMGVAFVSGIAASYCLARPKLSGALAGVAIAAALVPPIATTGICLAMAKFDVAQGAALLFGTNVVAIVFGSALNFYLAGIRGKSSAEGLWAKRVMISCALLMLGLMVPLSSAILNQLAGGPGLELALNEVASTRGVAVVELDKRPRKNGVRIVELTVESSSPVDDALVQELERAAKENTGEEIRLRVVTVLVREG